MRILRAGVTSLTVPVLSESVGSLFLTVDETELLIRTLSPFFSYLGLLMGTKITSSLVKATA